MFTLIYSDPLTRLNFWSIRTLKILAWVSYGISETSSINKVPLLALSKAPKDVFPSSSSPKSSFSYVFSLSNAAFKITKDSFALGEFLCIFLATSSFPDPVGPEIKTLLSDDDSFSIVFFIFVIAGLFPIKSNE